MPPEDWHIHDEIRFIFPCVFFVLLKFIVQMITRNNHLLGVISVSYILLRCIARFWPKVPMTELNHFLGRKSSMTFPVFLLKKIKMILMTRWWHAIQLCGDWDEGTWRHGKKTRTWNTRKLKQQQQQQPKFLYISKKIYYAVKEYKRRRLPCESYCVLLLHLFFTIKMRGKKETIGRGQKKDRRWGGEQVRPQM